jgi:hypothetical protein
MDSRTIEDPIQAEVARVLRDAVGLALALPFAAVTRMQRCTATTVGRVTAPLRLLWSLADATFGRALSPVESALDVVNPPRPVPSPAATARRLPTEPAEAVDELDEELADDDDAAAAALPIEEYESLAASHVVARLGALTSEELRAVRAFEAAHRGRRTVLGKIDQLLA